MCYCVNGCDAVNIVDSMLLTFADRSSDSPFGERVWRSHSERAEEFQSIAASHWNIVVTRLEGRMSLTVRGPETKATMASCAGHGEWFGILFKLGTFMPLMRSSDLRDRNDVTLPNASRRSFWLKGSAWDFPDFENAETFVKRLVQAGLVVADRTVVGAIRGELQNVTMRTEQRHVLQVTGLTLGTICQIERARRDASFEARNPDPRLVHSTGYYDQAHLTRSLRRFIGQTPARIARGEQQLSLLYDK